MRIEIGSVCKAGTMFRACLRYGFVFLLATGAACAQQIPNVRCKVEDYVLSPGSKVQVVVLRDPAGEQEARFDLTHGASLISLRYQGRELLYGHGAGAHLEMFKIRHGAEQELKGLSPYWSAFHADQAGSSMGVPATVAGVACHGEESMRAFAMMIDAGVDNSFQRHPLIGVWKGRVSDNFPPGYSTPYSVETDARWVANPGKEPKYYLRLDQTVVNIRATDAGSLQWFLAAAAPWTSEYEASYPENCTEQSPCTSQGAPAIAVGRYQNQAKTEGFATVVPTGIWKTNKVYQRANVFYVTLLYPHMWLSPQRTFATVLTHTLPGTSGFHFWWYVCAGRWDQARTFAENLRR